MNEQFSKYVSMGFDPAEVEEALGACRTDEEIFGYLWSRRSASLPKNQLFESHILTPAMRQRQAGQPVAIQNVGNTCYLSSLLQSYYMLPAFYKLVMDLPGEQGMLDEIQAIFASLTGSCCRYVSPANLFRRLFTDANGEFNIEQRDLSETNMKIIEGLENMYANSPELRRSHPLAANRNSIFFPVFYGSAVQFLQHSSGKVERTASVIGQLVLDATKSDDLYAACDEALNTSIEGYTGPEGTPDIVRSSTYFESLPKILIIQLNRLVYDSQSACLKKVNRLFAFPKVFQPGRFFIENYQRTQEVENELVSLKLQIKTKEDELGRSDAALDHRLRGEIEALRATVEGLYEHPDFHTHPYYLHSILVHHGSADGGHYYCFIYDKLHQKWRRFSDIHVEEVPESVVFQVCLGVEQDVSAYGLIYADATLLEETADKPIRTYSIGFTEDMYSEWVPEALQAKVIETNQQETLAYEQAVYGDLIPVIQQMFDGRRTIVTSLKLPNQNAEKMHFPQFCNACVYLHSQKAKQWQRHLLDMTVRELSGQTLEQIQTQNSYLYKALNTKYRAIMTQESKESKESLHRYTSAWKILELTNYICLSRTELINTLGAIVHILSNSSNEEFLQVCQTVAILQVLYLQMLYQVLQLDYPADEATAIQLLQHAFFVVTWFSDYLQTLEDKYKVLLKAVIQEIIKTKAVTHQARQTLEDIHKQANQGNMATITEVNMHCPLFQDILKKNEEIDPYLWEEPNRQLQKLQEIAQNFLLLNQTWAIAIETHTQLHKNPKNVAKVFFKRLK